MGIGDKFENKVCTDLTGGNIMGLDDKIDNKSDEFKGKAKENIGDATNNRDLEADGQADQAKAGMKQAGEHVKDAAKDATNR